MIIPASYPLNNEDQYYGEMEMKRKQRSRIWQTPFWIYRILSGYGERYVQALLVLIGMWVAFSLLFMFAGYEYRAMGLYINRDLRWNPVTTQPLR